MSCIRCTCEVWCKLIPGPGPRKVTVLQLRRGPPVHICEPGADADPQEPLAIDFANFMGDQGFGGAHGGSFEGGHGGTESGGSSYEGGPHGFGGAGGSFVMVGGSSLAGGAEGNGFSGTGSSGSSGSSFGGASGSNLSLEGPGDSSSGGADSTSFFDTSFFEGAGGSSIEAASGSGKPEMETVMAMLERLGLEDKAAVMHRLQQALGEGADGGLVGQQRGSGSGSSSGSSKCCR